MHAKHFARRVSIQLCIHVAGTSLRFIASYHLHISKYNVVRDSVCQGSKFESKLNPEKQYCFDPFVKMCSMGEHINPDIIDTPAMVLQLQCDLHYIKLGKADSGSPGF